MKVKRPAKVRAMHAFLTRKRRREDPEYRQREIERSYRYFKKRQNDLEYRENHNAAQVRYEERQEILGENAIIAHRRYKDYPINKECNNETCT